MLVWQLKNTLTDTEISTLLNVYVLAIISDMSYWPGVTGQGAPALPEVFGAHSQAALHRRWLAHQHTHTSTRTHLLEEIIIHYPFKEKNIFISLQWHLLCKMSLQQCTQAAHRNWVLCCGTWPGVHGKMCSALSPSFVRDAAVTARGIGRDNNKIYK